MRPIKHNMAVAQTLHGNTAESKSFDISRTGCYGAAPTEHMRLLQHQLQTTAPSSHASLRSTDLLQKALFFF